MIDLNYFKELVKLLKDNKIQYFKKGDLELKLAEILPQELAFIPDQKQTVTLPEQQMPIDLRTDPVNEMDKILNWSAGPQDDPNGLPLTDEKELQ